MQTMATMVKNKKTKNIKIPSKNLKIPSTNPMTDGKGGIAGSFSGGGMSDGVWGISASVMSMIAPSSVEWKVESSSKICGVYMEDGYWGTKVNANHLNSHKYKKV